MATFFLMTPGYYAHGKSTTACWVNLRRISGRTKAEVRKQPYFMLEFAENNVPFTVNGLGQWRCPAYPVRVVEHHKQDPATLKQFAAWCKEGQLRALAAHGGKVAR